MDEKTRFLKIRMIWAIIKGNPVICNAKFKGEINLLSKKAFIVNNTFLN